MKPASAPYPATEPLRPPAFARGLLAVLSVALTAMVHLSLPAQVVLERSVIGALGNSETTGGFVLEYTAGEPVIKTVQNQQVILTQGFHQSGIISPLAAEILITDVSCPSATDGAIALINIRGGEPPYEIVWSNGESGSSIDRLSPGLYNYTITSSRGVLTGEVEVGTGDPDACRLRFFNAFSPNGDGENDRWTIENIHLPEFAQNTIKIFNRWGQEVNRFEGYDNSSTVWEGTAQDGKDLPVGTYFYIAEAGGTLYKGYIELIR